MPRRSQFPSEQKHTGFRDLRAAALVFVLLLENADVSPSERWHKSLRREQNSLFAAEAQQIEHDDEHDLT
ncbi:MAG: hypothetical protein JO170_22760 [Verrucomicrobia bacterium]|nr:hypothetical protein [Verrucomicrobiota bacterium]